MVLRTYSYGAVVKPRSTMERATRSGSRAHRLDDFRMARTARLVATGCARTNSLGGEERVGADVDASQHDDGMAGVHLFDPDADEAHRKVDLSPRESSGTLWGVRRHVSHISETLQLQQLVGDELRSDAHTGERLHRSLDPEREGLRRRLGGGGLRTQPEKARGPGQGQSTHEAASTRAFASVTHRAPPASGECNAETPLAVARSYTPRCSACILGQPL